jgi:hypothetical protein
VVRRVAIHAPTDADRPRLVGASLKAIDKRGDVTEVLGSWTINYLPGEGERFTGTLEVREDRIFFDTIYESSNRTIVKAIFLDVTTFAAAGGHTVYRYSNDDKAIVDLPIEDVASVNAAKKGMMKRAVITMKNGEEFVFDYGMLSVKNLVSMIQGQIDS